jgi:putative redox protein
MNKIEVSHLGADRFVACVRGHEIGMDQPVTEGGTDLGPSPTEIFVTGLVGCTAYYARRYLARHGLDGDGLRVTAEWDFAADRPARVGSIHIVVIPPAGLPEERRDGLLATARHCTVHNTLRQPPDVDITLAGDDR